VCHIRCLCLQILSSGQIIIISNLTSKDLLPLFQEPAIGEYSEPDEFNPLLISLVYRISDKGRVETKL